MPLKSSPLTHAELLRCLSWDPDTGHFTWLIDASHRIKAGTPAGLVTQDGRYVVTLHGERFYGHHLAFFYANGTWPDGEPRFRDLDRSNCSAHNLYFIPKRYSDAPAAKAARKYKARKQRHAQVRDDTRVSPIDGIVRSQATGGWVIYHPEDAYRHVVIGKTRSFSTAALLFYERVAACRYIDAHPVPPSTAADIEVYAGTREAISLADVRAWLAYDPDAGAFYHRTRHSHAEVLAPRASDDMTIKGLRADELNTNGTPVIGFFGRDYSAASLAVFMRTGVWPAPRSVRFKDGNKANLVWANLVVDEKDAE